MKESNWRETFQLQQIMDSCLRKDEKCCNHFSLRQHREHLLIKRTFYVTIILPYFFHSNMLLFIVLTKPIWPYEKHGKKAVLFIQNCCQCISVQYHVRQSSVFQPFIHGGVPCLCKRFTYRGGKNVAHGLYFYIANSWTNIPWKFEGIRGIFHGILKFLCVCACHDFLRNSFDVLQNAGWETLQ